MTQPTPPAADPNQPGNGQPPVAATGAAVPPTTQPAPSAAKKRHPVRTLVIGLVLLIVMPIASFVSIAMAMLNEPFDPGHPMLQSGSPYKVNLLGDQKYGVYSSTPLAGCELENTTGETIAVTEASGGMKNNDLPKVAEFTTTAGGEHLIECTAEDGSRATYSVSMSATGLRPQAMIAMGIAIVFALAGIATIIIAIVQFVRRGKDRKAEASSPAVPWPSGSGAQNQQPGMSETS